MMLDYVERCENMKKKLLIIGIVICVLIALFYLFVISGAFLMLTYFAPNPPEPEITYGEFPFVLTYELDGEIKTIEDVVICEYDGIEWTNSGSKERKWKLYIKSTGKEMISLKDLSNENDFTDWGNQVLELCSYPGHAEYYMNDPDSYFNRLPEEDNMIDYLYITPEGKKGYSAFTADEALERYNIRIIKWEYSKQIENSYK